MYIQEGSSFTTSSGFEWVIKTKITCGSKNVIYFLKCLFCEDQTNPETNIGKTNNFRLRMHNHIYMSRKGNSTDIFDNHVHECMKRSKKNEEPFFQIFAFLTVNKGEALLTYEKYLQRRGFDTINNPSTNSTR